ncbi:DUF4258 domain-containing protein [Shinella sp. CPCC 100929]|uniref:DUF4258 domain-containing protein n=1 Tax=Shinella lacus TaxID=2654216 RepID=A0ABT1R743_9HYPH|nr:DUF4258 domain-containing protein [Shinella lacus]MCQ4630992.1 DUF4258 domain-containing protein [Shinella lacus]
MDKPLRYSLHAETVMRERKLDPAWIEATVRAPEWRLSDPSGPEVERRYRAIEALDGRILRVVCVEASDEVRIISAFIDRGARKPA